jgi:hypothetical protein
MSKRHAIEAILSEKSDRYHDWLEVFGTNRVPVISPLSRTVELPIGTRECFMLCVEALDSGQRERLVAHLARKFPIAADIIADELRRNGLMPLLAEDVFTVVGARLL